jgi:xanthine/uracil permease
MLFIIFVILTLTYFCYVVGDVFSSLYFNDPMPPETIGHIVVLIGLSLITLGLKP